MIGLLDASAAVDLLVRSDAGEQVRRWLESGEVTAVVTVAHVDAEVLSALARLARAELLDVDEVGVLLERLGSLDMERLPITTDLLAAAWELRDNVAARDALHVAAASAIGATLVTTDHRLARSVPQLAADLG